MAEPIVIKIKLDSSEIARASGEIRKGVQSALDPVIASAKDAGKKIGDALGAGITDEMAKKLRSVRDSLNAIGNTTGASNTTKSLKDSEAAALRLAQAMARLKQISGDTQGAIRVLGDALAKASNPRSIAAVRAEIQKTYLETNYANSPLINAIRQTRAGFEGLPPIISKATSLFTGLLGGLVGGGLIAGLEKLGSVALSSAIEIDKNRQTLIALTGSADAANRKLAELRDLAAKSPGVTSRVAIDVFNQLKATGEVAEASINKLIKGIGKLNAVFTIDDVKQFSRNITQIFTQGFERADIKEALGRVPIFAQLLESAFGTKDAGKLRKLKDSGKLTMDTFAAGLADAINTNPVLSNVQESLGSRFEKAKDNILIALEPLGAEIGKVLLSLADEVGAQLQASRDEFNDLIAAAKDFGDTLTDSAGDGQTKLFDLRAELEAVKAIIDFLNGGVLFLKDSFELLGTLAVGVVKQIALTIEQALSKALGFVGIQIGSLEEDIIRLSGDLSQLENRFNQGFINTRNFNARSDARNITVDAGNAVPVDANGRPLNPADALPFRSRGGGGGRGGGGSAESKARQLREVLLAQQKAFIEQNNRLLEDANKRELEQFQQLYDDKKVTIREFYDAKLGLTQQNVGNEINALQQEITAQEKALSAAKAGTPEKIRIETELFKLRTELTLKTRELGDVEIRNLREFTKAATEEREKLLKETQSLALKLDESNLPTGAIAGEITPEQQRARQALLDSQRAATQFSVLDLELRKQELQIQNAINAGVLTEAQGKEATLTLQRQYRDALIQSLEIQKQATIDPETINRLNVEIEQLRSLGQELTPLQALFKGFRSQAETLAESFERIGGAFKDKVLGVVDAGIDKLTSKLGFFKSLVGDILKSLTRVLLGNLLQPRAAGGGGGLGGFLGNILGGGGGGGSFGSFATGGFAGGGGASSILGGGGGGGGLLGSLSGLLGGGGGGISAPPSATNPLGGLASIFRGGSGGGFSPIIQDSVLGNQRLGGLGGLSSLFSGIGFGKTPGSGGALAGALPLLGIGLGSQLGSDRLTSLIGGIGGGLLGVGLTAAPAILGAGGALSGLGFLAPLFSNPFTAIAGAALLPLAFFLGRARQRRRDESASGDFLQEAIDNIREMRKRIESNELVLTITEARRQFEAEILEPFKAQINTLKTKSVRESRLKNQTADLKNLFEKEVIPAVQAQKNRQTINDKIIPEFAFGGIVPGRPTPGIDSVIARLSPGEMVLTQRHQAAIASVAGTGIFQAVGVPDAGQAQGDGSQAFAFGGVVSPARSIAPTINMTVQLMVSADEATNILNAAASTDDGQIILVNARKQAARNGLGRTRA